MTDNAPPENTDNDPLPLVGEDQGNRPLWIGMGLVAGLGLLLFTALEARRKDQSAPATRRDLSTVLAAQSSLPELYVPPEPRFGRPVNPPELPIPARLPPAWIFPLLPEGGASRVATLPVRTPVNPSEPAPSYTPTIPTLNNPARSTNGGTAAPAIVFDGSSPPPDSLAARQPSGSAMAYTIPPAARARAAQAGGREAVVPQGTLIPAVLETAMDSTQPGQVRALVSQNVTNLKGDKVLIPKGSRLFGDYRGELSAGQKRAQVQWGLLVRPDGVSIALDSPATDLLGRAGVTGRVRTYFFERLGGALLQSSLDVGALAASRGLSNSNVVVAVPGAVQGATSQLVPQAPKPTLRVRHGISISVLVARDLDFAGVEVQR